MATLAHSVLTRSALQDDAPQASSSPTAAVVAPPPRSRAKVLLPVLIGLAAAAAGVTWAVGRGTETTDDAQVEGHVANVSARITGQVKRVLVKDNQQVKAGDVLVVLDDRDYVVKLAAAKADLAAAEATLRNAETQLVLTQKGADTNVVVARGGVTQAAALDGTPARPSSKLTPTSTPPSRGRSSPTSSSIGRPRSWRVAPFRSPTTTLTRRRPSRPKRRFVRCARASSLPKPISVTRQERSNRPEVG